MSRDWAELLAVVLVVRAGVHRPLSSCDTSVVARELYKFLQGSLVDSSFAEQLVHATASRGLSENYSKDAHVSVPA